MDWQVHARVLCESRRPELKEEVGLRVNASERHAPLPLPDTGHPASLYPPSGCGSQLTGERARAACGMARTHPPQKCVGFDGPFVRESFDGFSDEALRD